MMHRVASNAKGDVLRLTDFRTLRYSRRHSYQARREKVMTVQTPRTGLDQPVAPDPRRAYTLPSRFYTDPGVYEREKPAIFNRSWHYIGHESHVARPGDYLTLEIADESVFIRRGEDGVVRGFFNICRHRAHRLLKGMGNCQTIVCPYHAWSYDDEGCLKHARFASDLPAFNPGEFCLPGICVESLHGMLFVNLDTDAPSIAHSAPGFAKDLAQWVPRLAELKPVDNFTFDTPDSAHWAANWKVVVDNYVECYHCAPAHPALADLMRMQSYELDVHERWSRQLSQGSNPENSAYTFSPEDDVQIAAYWYLWPTTSIWMVPGTANLFVLAMMPEGHDKTIFSGHRYAVDAREDAARSTYLNAILGPEDKGLCESVQQGLKSQSYNQGRFMVDRAASGTGEQALHQFHRLIMGALAVQP